MSDNNEKMHYIGIAFEDIDDAMAIFTQLMDNDKVEIKYSANVHKVIDILRGIDDQYQARCIVCRDQCEHIA